MSSIPPATTPITVANETKLVKERTYAIKHAGEEEDVPREERRYDTLARLLASESICVAVAVLNEDTRPRLYISANEIFAGSRDNAASKSITTILNYFSSFSNRKLGTAEQAKREMRALFSEHLATAFRINELTKGGALQVPNTIQKEVIELLMTPSIVKPNIHTYITTHKTSAAAAGLTYGAFSNVWKDLLRMQEFLAPTGQTASKLYGALKNDYAILTKDHKNVHAEARLVSEIMQRRFAEQQKAGNTQLTPVEIYLGISKKCCLGCNILIDSANEVSERMNLNLKIKIRGAHNLLKESAEGEPAWESPAIFERGFDRGYIRMSDETDGLIKDGSPYETLFYKIGFLSGQKLKAELQRKNGEKKQNKGKKASVSMVPDRSDSDTDSISGEELQNLQYLLWCQRLLKMEFSPDPNVMNYLNNLRNQAKQAQFLLNTTTYRTIINSFDDDIDINEINNTFGYLLKDLQEDISRTEDISTTEENLIGLLQKPVLIGEKLVRYFSKFIATKVNPRMSSTPSPSVRAPMPPSPISMGPSSTASTSDDSKCEKEQANSPLTVASPSSPPMGFLVTGSPRPLYSRAGQSSSSSVAAVPPSREGTSPAPLLLSLSSVNVQRSSVSSATAGHAPLSRTSTAATHQSTSSSSSSSGSSLGRSTRVRQAPVGGKNPKKGAAAKKSK